MSRIYRFSFSVDNIGDFSKHLQSVGVHYSKSPKSGAFGERFNEERGCGLEFDFGVLELGEFWWVVNLCSSGLLSHLPQDPGHLAGNLGGTGEDNRTVSRFQNTRVLLNSDQGGETLDWLELTVLFVVNDISGGNLFVLGNTLDGETNGVTRSSRFEILLVLFNRENLLTLKIGWYESNLVTRSEGSLFNSSTDNLANSLDVVDVGNRKTEWGIGETLGGDDEVVEAINNGETCDFLLGDLVSGPSLVPRALGRVDGINQVVSVETRVRDERNLLGLVSNHLKHFNELILDFVETILGPVA